MTKKVGIVIGSLRKEAFSRKLADALQALTPAALELDKVGIGDLVVFNQDFDDEGNTPEGWQAFRRELKKFDAFLFITPEHNRSVPSALKNALDIGSRPYGKNLWNGKPGAVISISPGALSAFGAHHHLRQVLVFLNVPTMPQPEAYIGNAATLFDDSGALVNEGAREFLKKFMLEFAAWIEANGKTA